MTLKTKRNIPYLVFVIAFLSFLVITIGDLPITAYIAQ